MQQGSGVTTMQGVAPIAVGRSPVLARTLSASGRTRTPKEVSTLEELLRRDRNKELLSSDQIVQLIDLSERVHSEKVRQRKGAKNPPTKVTLKRRLQEYRYETAKSDGPFTVGVYPIEKLTDIKPALILNLYANNFTFENQATSYPYSALAKTLLSYIDQQTIPLDMADVLDDPSCPFYDGCLLVEVRNHRANPGPEIRRILLHPSAESLASDLHNLVQQSGQRWNQDEWLEVEKKIVLATSDPLCLDPSPNVALVANRLHYTRDKFNLHYKRRRFSDKDIFDRADKIKDVDKEEDFVPGVGMIKKKEFIPRFPLLSFLDQRRSDNPDFLADSATRMKTAAALAAIAMSQPKDANNGIKRPVYSESATYRSLPISPYMFQMMAKNKTRVRNLRFERKENRMSTSMFVAVDINRAVPMTPMNGVFENVVRIGRVPDMGTNGDVFKCYFETETYAHVHANSLKSHLTQIEHYQCTMDNGRPEDMNNAQVFISNHQAAIANQLAVNSAANNGAANAANAAFRRASGQGGVTGLPTQPTPSAAATVAGGNVARAPTPRPAPGPVPAALPVGTLTTTKAIAGNPVSYNTSNLTAAQLRQAQQQKMAKQAGTGTIVATSTVPPGTTIPATAPLNPNTTINGNVAGVANPATVSAGTARNVGAVRPGQLGTQPNFQGNNNPQASLGPIAGTAVAAAGARPMQVNTPGARPANAAVNASVPRPMPATTNPQRMLVIQQQMNQMRMQQAAAQGRPATAVTPQFVNPAVLNNLSNGHGIPQSINNPPSNPTLE